MIIYTWKLGSAHSWRHTSHNVTHHTTHSWYRAKGLANGLFNICNVTRLNFTLWRQKSTRNSEFDSGRHYSCFTTRSKNRTENLNPVVLLTSDPCAVGSNTMVRPYRTGDVTAAAKAVPDAWTVMHGVCRSLRTHTRYPRARCWVTHAHSDRTHTYMRRNSQSSWSLVNT